MPTALLSVSDKQSLVELGRGLRDLGWDLLASGGTARALQQADLPVEEVAEYTSSPEILGGRVKTLHPAVHAGILARDNLQDTADLERIAARKIDLVAVNLYPFQAVISRQVVSFDEAIENIDIGGVALIRAAAKNFGRVVVLTDPNDYPQVLAELQKQGEVSEATRYRLARKAFAHTAAYDAHIAAYLGGLGSDQAGGFVVELYPQGKLRYGENPHQEAELYTYQPGLGPLGGELLQGKTISYNNLLDLDAAWRAAVSFEKPAVCIVKHLSPCGIACNDSLSQAFRDALASDPVSAFGGVIAANRPFDVQTAEALSDLFVECIAAPGFSQDSLQALGARKNVRLLDMPDTSLEPSYELRSINQGVLRQSIDRGDPPGVAWKVVSKRNPTETELSSLRFAWRACQHVKSNAIVLVRGEATVGIGGGQPNRVDCVRIAVRRAGSKASGAVMASDAFFPFPDSVLEAAQAGVTAIVSPGGSIRDDQAIAAADQANISMLFTGVRHFRH